MGLEGALGAWGGKGQWDSHYLVVPPWLQQEAPTWPPLAGAGPMSGL